MAQPRCGSVPGGRHIAVACVGRGSQQVRTCASPRCSPASAPARSPPASVPESATRGGWRSSEARLCGTRRGASVTRASLEVKSAALRSAASTPQRASRSRSRRPSGLPAPHSAPQKRAPQLLAGMLGCSCSQLWVMWQRAHAGGPGAAPGRGLGRDDALTRAQLHHCAFQLHTAATTPQEAANEVGASAGTDGEQASARARELVRAVVSGSSSTNSVAPSSRPMLFTYAKPYDPAPQQSIFDRALHHRRRRGAELGRC